MSRINHGTRSTMTLEGAQKMMCGNCGKTAFSVYESKGKILTECRACRSFTVINIQPAELMLEFGKGSEGILCPAR